MPKSIKLNKSKTNVYEWKIHTLFTAISQNYKKKFHDFFSILKTVFYF